MWREIEDPPGRWIDSGASDCRLSDSEARHLRDWLCEQFGLPEAPCNICGERPAKLITAPGLCRGCDEEMHRP